MKKLFALLALVAFLAIAATPAQAAPRRQNIVVNNGNGGASVVTQQFGLFGNLRSQTVVNNGLNGGANLQRGIGRQAILVSPSNSIFLSQPRFVQLSDGSLILVR